MEYSVARLWSKRKAWGIAADDGEFLGYVRRDDPTGSGCCFTFKKNSALQFDSRAEAERWIAEREA